MGCSTQIACKTCKKLYYLGYGSYGRSREREKRFPAEDHLGHDIEGAWIDDYEYGVEDDTLYAMGVYGSRGEIILEGYSTYEQVDLSHIPLDTNLNPVHQ